MSDKDTTAGKLHDALDELMEEDIQRYEKDIEQGKAGSAGGHVLKPDFAAGKDVSAGKKPGKRGRIIRFLAYAAAACLLLAVGYGAGLAGNSGSIYPAKGTDSGRSYENSYTPTAPQETAAVSEMAAVPSHSWRMDSSYLNTDRNEVDGGVLTEGMLSASDAAVQAAAAPTENSEMEAMAFAEAEAPAIGENAPEEEMADEEAEPAEDARKADDEAAEDRKAEDGAGEGRKAEDEAAEDRKADDGAGEEVEEVQETKEALPRKLVTTYNISGESLNFEADTEAVESRLASLGGYVESSSLRDSSNASSGTRSITYTLRVPAGSAAGFVDYLAGSLHITAKSENTRDITLDYYDVATRLDSYRSELGALENLMEKAENISDILEIEAAVTDLHYRIDSCETSLRTMDNQVDYTTVTLSVQEVRQTTETGRETVGQRISRGFSEAAADIAHGAQDLFVWFVSNILYVIIVCALLAALILFFRRMRRRHNAS